MLERQINMNKLNIKEYKTKGGEVRYILRGAYIGTDVLTGKQVRTSITGRTKKDIKVKLLRLQNEFIKNGCTKKVKVLKTFDEVAAAWFDFYKINRKSATVKQTEKNLRLYLLPAFGNYKIDKLTTAILQHQINVWAKIASKPLNGRQARKKGEMSDYKRLYTIINRIMKYAISNGLISSNPCLTVLMPNVKVESTKKEIKFFTKSQLQSLFDYLNSQDSPQWKMRLLKNLLPFLASTGLRIGEAVALSWSDINFNQGTVTVSKTVNDSNQIQFSPKTETSNRTIDIDKSTLNLLSKWQLEIKKEFLKYGKPNQPLLFPNLNGSVLNSRLLRNTLLDCFENVGLPNIGFHGFRHTHATLCLSAGMSYKAIQTRLGHSTLQMTMDIYAHLEPETAKNELSLFEKYLNYSNQA